MPKRRAAPSSDDDEWSDELDEDTGGVPGRLNPPMFGTLSVRELYDMIKKKKIDLDVEFQREVVWPAPKQSGLILSLLQNFPIPPVYFSLREDQIRGEYRATLDGKQRLTSIYRFFEGQIPYIPEGSKQKLYYKNTVGSGKASKRLVLTAPLRKDLEKKTLTCVQYEALTDVQERDMFQRVQLGMPLKEGEKLQSKSGPWAAWITTLMGTYVFADKALDELLDWDTSRGTGFQCVAGVVCSLRYPANTAHKSYSALNKFLETPTPPDPRFRASVENVLQKLLQIAGSEELSYPFRVGTPRVAPVEFVMTCILINLMSDRPLFEITKEIDNLRVETRKQFVDVRNNTRVFTGMLAIIKKVASSLDKDAEYVGEVRTTKKRKNGS